MPGSYEADRETPSWASFPGAGRRRFARRAAPRARSSACRIWRSRRGAFRSGAFQCISRGAVVCHFCRDSRRRGRRLMAMAIAACSARGAGRTRYRRTADARQIPDSGACAAGLALCAAFLFLLASIRRSVLRRYPARHGSRRYDCRSSPCSFHCSSWRGTTSAYAPRSSFPVCSCSSDRDREQHWIRLCPRGGQGIAGKAAPLPEHLRSLGFLKPRAGSDQRLLRLRRPEYSTSAVVRHSFLAGFLPQHQRPCGGSDPGARASWTSMVCAIGSADRSRRMPVQRCSPIPELESLAAANRPAPCMADAPR